MVGSAREVVSQPAPIPLVSRPRWARWLKRAVDVVGAGTGLALLWPVIGAAAVAVRASSGGPVFYPWIIAGEGGRRVRSYKLRTMVAGAHAMRHTLKENNEMGGPFFKMHADPRVTPVGKWLRRYSIDELPQLISVLKGDLSLVGPRPAQWDEWLRLDGQYRRRASVRPGMTCLWQISGRHEVRFEDWMQLDLEYIDRWSLGLDLEILLRTIPVAVRGTGI